MYLKDFLSKSQLKTFIEEREKLIVKKIDLKKDRAIITTKLKPESYIAFHPHYGYLQSVDVENKEAVIVIQGKEYNYIMNEIDFFRRKPNDANKMGYTII